ncbi:uncharacterized protein KLLA0_D07524g [Kluyveromyces lactis]|uniref:KLLA0D07524p n=1 Tax=Kluyveromyces lactis (strain ATCC 8585 / CBS 2359 / DSM 70799 / NBRC 1267 / NRRL Y-1140 / WM37) TaxID=284590 RepID=Q6CRP1_KLULA|nr:uncharacterized protein KLLA0_D07524g [Kluyveromyces lactis]CAH00494.1 KLLA0D07524p [Kluyveromyces lactis]|eukprot:XP_453398.1 uncharacterized protein KLLA0_D07524g [Kluyveromyces lactis]
MSLQQEGSSSASSSSSRISQRNKQVGSQSEENLTVEALRTQELSVGLIVSAFVLVLSCGVIFLLGVNIVIQYRTINWGYVPKAILKMTYILLSVVSIFYINKFNLYFFRLMNNRDTSNAYASIPQLEPVQMKTGV